MRRWWRDWGALVNLAIGLLCVPLYFWWVTR